MPLVTDCQLDYALLITKFSTHLAYLDISVMGDNDESLVERTERTAVG